MGNMDPRHAGQQGKRFMDSYGEHFSKQEKFAATATSPQKIIDGIRAMQNNFPGLDGALTEDLAVFPYPGAKWL